MELLPDELLVEIAAYLDYKEFVTIEAQFKNYNYIRLMELKFPKFYNKNLYTYDVRSIYRSLLFVYYNHYNRYYKIDYSESNINNLVCLYYHVRNDLIVIYELIRYIYIEIINSISNINPLLDKDDVDTLSKIMHKCNNTFFGDTIFHFAGSVDIPKMYNYILQQDFTNNIPFDPINTKTLRLINLKSLNIGLSSGMLPDFLLVDVYYNALDPEVSKLAFKKLHDKLNMYSFKQIIDETKFNAYKLIQLLQIFKYPNEDILDLYEYLMSNPQKSKDYFIIINFLNNHPSILKEYSYINYLNDSNQDAGTHH